MTGTFKQVGICNAKATEVIVVKDGVSAYAEAATRETGTTVFLKGGGVLELEMSFQEFSGYMNDFQVSRVRSMRVTCRTGF